eukprot:TRINITY_DN5987_c0_g1_i2.p1 TRINITY_DN5987_c0_g1~~TRINITY_DN5987_c0_g1_i2.p1  ORF type:complete len:463 (+),score=65.91 TRINITY_DN5987_c0_g1_i2:181-1389(+)
MAEDEEELLKGAHEEEKVLSVAFITKERIRLLMSLLTAIYVGVAVLFLYMIMVQLQPTLISQAHETIRMAIGDIAYQGYATSVITDYPSFWSTLSDIVNMFFSVYDDDAENYIFQSYYYVWGGLLFQWKRGDCMVDSPGCFGGPIYDQSADPFLSGLNWIANHPNVTSADPISYEYFHPGDGNTTIDAEFSKLRIQRWLNTNTSLTYFVLFLYNPSITVGTTVIMSTEWSVSSLTTTMFDIYSYANILTSHRYGATEIALQVIAFVGILGLLIFESVRIYRHVEADGRFTFSTIIFVIGIAISAAMTIATITLWLILLTDQAYKLDFDTNTQLGLPEYISILKLFYTNYSFLEAYRLVISISILHNLYINHQINQLILVSLMMRHYHIHGKTFIVTFLLWGI